VNPSRAFSTLACTAAFLHRRAHGARTVSNAEQRRRVVAAKGHRCRQQAPPFADRCFGGTTQHCSQLRRVHASASRPLISGGVPADHCPVVHHVAAVMLRLKT
jgi:hypothetical protein